MKQVIISHEGYPGTTALLQLLSDASYETNEALAKMLGDKVSVFGATVNGSSLSNGLITFGGELIPLTGGNITTSPNVKIVETPIMGEYMISPSAPALTPGVVAKSKIAVLTSDPVGVNIFPHTQLRPIRNIAMISASGIVQVSDFASTAVYTVQIPNQGNNEYQVICTLHSLTSTDGTGPGTGSWGNSSVGISTYAQTPTSFKFRVSEWGDSAQLLYRVQYIILKSL